MVRLEESTGLLTLWNLAAMHKELLTQLRSAGNRLTVACCLQSVDIDECTLR